MDGTDIGGNGGTGRLSECSLEEKIQKAKDCIAPWTSDMSEDIQDQSNEHGKEYGGIGIVVSLFEAGSYS
jgi:hypothetical protein